MRKGLTAKSFISYWVSEFQELLKRGLNLMECWREREREREGDIAKDALPEITTLLWCLNITVCYNAVTQEYHEIEFHVGKKTLSKTTEFKVNGIH